MADEQATKQQIIDAGAFLWRQFVDAKTIGETLRLLLIERRVFTDAEYLAKYDEVAATLQRDLDEKLKVAIDTIAGQMLLKMPIDREH